MTIQIIKEKIKKGRQPENQVFEFDINKKTRINVYPNSIIDKGEQIFFIGREGTEKSLYILSKNPDSELLKKFDGIELNINGDSAFELLKKCSMNTKNRLAVQEIFDFTRPRVLGLVNSFGFGDRLGLANPAHIRSLSISNFKPILAQQSVRELTRTQRKPDDVMDAAVYAILQEGYKDGFGADADHLKTADDIDLLFEAGYTMFTFDPGEHVDNSTNFYDAAELKKKVSELNWNELNDNIKQAQVRYVNKEFKISGDFVLKPSEADFLKAYAKYGKAIIHIKKMYDHLLSLTSKDKFEVEVSVDETESVTTLFEHFFIANELKRLGVSFISLAPRFIGDFEKGIDYKGDLNLFKNEYEKHLAITKYFGNYKISLHSGSDKFSVYKVIGSLKEAYTHVKTAGTSYLEALKVTALKEPALFREILDFACGLYETEKKSYHVSADLSKIKPSGKYSEKQLVDLFNDNNTRQILHVTYGRVLTDKNQSGNYIFKDRIINCLKENEDVYYQIITKHFHKHLEPFN